MESHKRREVSYAAKLFTSLLLCAGEINNGITLSMIGPSLLDLAKQSNSTISQVSWYLSLEGVGAMFGVFIQGKTLGCRIWMLLLGLAHVVGGLLYACLPWIPLYPLADVGFFVHGILHCITSIGGTMTFFTIWDEKQTEVSWISAHMTCISIGYAVGPLIVAQFFNQDSVPEYSEIHANFTSNHTRDDILVATESSHFMFAFLVAGAIAVVIGITFIFSFCLNVSRFHSTSSEHTTKINKKTHNLSAKFIFICFLFVVLNWSSVIYSGTGYAAYLTSYVVSELDMSKSQGAYLTSAFNGAKCFTRFCGIFLARHVSFSKILYASITLACLAYLSLTLLVHVFPPILWLGTILGAIGCGNVFPMGLGLAESILGYDRLPGILYGIGYKVGEITTPLIIGNLFEYVVPDAYLYAVTSSAGIGMLTMVGLSLLGNQKDKLKLGESEPLLGDVKNIRSEDI